MKWLFYIILMWLSQGQSQLISPGDRLQLHSMDRSGVFLQGTVKEVISENSSEAKVLKIQLSENKLCVLKLPKEGPYPLSNEVELVELRDVFKGLVRGKPFLDYLGIFEGKITRHRRVILEFSKGLVMPYLPDTLRDLLRSSRQKFRRNQSKRVLLASEILDSLVVGLSEMHRRARVHHQDLKPENILVSSREIMEAQGERTYYFIDFDLALSLEAHSLRKGEGTIGYKGPVHFSPLARDLMSIVFISYEAVWGYPPLVHFAMEYYGDSFADSLFRYSPLLSELFGSEPSVTTRKVFRDWMLTKLKSTEKTIKRQKLYALDFALNLLTQWRDVDWAIGFQKLVQFFGSQGKVVAEPFNIQLLPCVQNLKTYFPHEWDEKQKNGIINSY